MKQQHLMLQPLGWEAIVFLDKYDNNSIIFKRIEDQNWYQGMYLYTNKKMIADTIEYKWVLEQNKYIILPVLFAMIQEDFICNQLLLAEDDFEQGIIPMDKIKQYSIKYVNRYDNYYTQKITEEE